MKCDLCQSENWELGLKIKKCLNCGFIAALDKYYSTSIDFNNLYSAKYYKGGDYIDYSLEEKALKQNFNDRLKIIKKYIKSGNGLEIGTGYGYFIQVASNNFIWEGVERNDSLAKSLSKKLQLKIHGGDFTNLNFNKKYDLIVSLDTIEHVASPNLFIKNCYEILESKGYLFLETGDIGALLPKVKKEKWRLINPPEHLSYLSKKTIKQYLEKNGFEVLEIKSVSFWRTVSQTFFRLFPNLYNSLPNALIRFIGNIIYPLNTGDLMFVVAKKISNS